jgi:UDP-N-acetylglucosamine 2-epimerase (non-hydrolysing)
MPQRVLILFGTRPEAIKLAPVVLELQRDPRFQPLVCVTAQHREMLDQVLRAFEIQPGWDLNLMRPGQSLSGLTGRMMSALEDVFRDASPDWAIVQGDTTTTFCGALAAFYHHVPLAHVEAGLRTGDLSQPFPEEANRVLTGRLASLHLAATDQARDNLLAERVDPARIEVTGNTGIDAVLLMRDRIRTGRQDAQLPPLTPGRKVIAVTAHRRESFGEGMESICRALARLAQRDDVQILFPVHPNPNVRQVVEHLLQPSPSLTLLEPLDYVPFVALMDQAHFLISDSGGVQEEAPALGRPVLVMREKTERPEGVTAGSAKLVGTNENRIVEEATRLLEDPAEYARMSQPRFVYGDGQASARIANRLAATP